MRPLALAILTLLAACNAPAPVEDAAGPPIQSVATGGVSPAVSPDEFGDYWYQGLAEITAYDLEQARYGELRDGSAVLIFVTEPFSRSQQVKLDQAGGADEVTVMKLNHTREFVTGIYPYSMMTSVFTPVSEGPLPLKITATSQEWCGHTFTQLNRTADGYRARLFSYFESEGDQDVSLGEAMPEDGLWALIRLNPDALPTGAVQLMPGTIYQRLSHRPMESYAATAMLSAPDADGFRTYTVTYPDLDRSLAIRFQAIFPHQIEGWEETRPDGFGDNASRLTTRATRTEREMLAYWQLNGSEDVSYRAELGL
ncbi:MAG: hypothetical protein HKN04_08410 [Rhodothermaceae bacterium]|nr:hypothetical protein [Rhodothermaceae bacterium]